VKASAPRALSGFLVLLVAAAALVVLNRVAAQRISGTAVTDWPAPPAVGSCIDLLSGGGGVAVVPCDGPHDAEVTKAYSALDPVLAASPSASIDAACADAARAHLGDGAGGEKPSSPAPADGPDHILALGLNFAASAAGAPAVERAGDRGWMICDIQPAQAARYSGSVRGATSADAPDAYRWCWSEADQRTPVSCAEPHAAELLGTAPGYTHPSVKLVVQVPPESLTSTGDSPGGESGGAGAAGDDDPNRSGSAAGSAAEEAAAERDRAETARRYSRLISETLQSQVQARSETLNRQCSALAAEVVGVSDPTYGGLLRTTMADLLGTSASIRVDEPATRGPDGSAGGVIGGDAGGMLTDVAPGTTLSMDVTFSRQSCLVLASGGRQLTRSLVGWGDRPPPLAGG